MATAAIALCWRCRRDTLPQLAKPSWHREKHRATAAEREPEPSPAALAAKRRKDRRREQSKLRKIARVEGILSAARFFCEIRGIPQLHTAPVDENCEDCRREQLRGQEIGRGSR